MSIQVCAVSGTLKTVDGVGVSGATVAATAPYPFIHTGDNSLIDNYSVSTTTASDGTWTLSLVETVTPNITLTLSFTYQKGPDSNTDRREYTVQIPNSATATFASLIGSQI